MVLQCALQQSNSANFFDIESMFRTRCATWPKELPFGFVDGHITLERQGIGGFGYDPVFAVEGRSFAEMGDEKHEISHRARALRALAAKLGSQG